MWWGQERSQKYESTKNSTKFRHININITQNMLEPTIESTQAPKMEKGFSNNKPKKKNQSSVDTTTP